MRIDTPADGRIYDFGAVIPFSVTVTDPEDGAVDCSRVKVTFVIGHDSHGHPQTSATGCTGTLRTLADGEPDPNTNIFGVVDAEYTDRGANGQPALTTHDQHITQPSHRQAEHYGDSAGVQIVDKASAHGGRTVDEIHDGDRISYTRTASTTPPLHRPRLLGGQRRHDRDPRGLPGRHPPRHGHRPGHRRLGRLPRRHSAPERPAGGIDRRAPRLQGRRRTASRSASSTPAWNVNTSSSPTMRSTRIWAGATPARLSCEPLSRDRRCAVTNTVIPDESQKVSPDRSSTTPWGPNGASLTASVSSGAV